MSPPTCPYCGRLLDPPPTRTRNCPDCGQKIICRKSGERISFLTESGAEEHDRNRALASARKKAVRRITILVSANEGSMDAFSMTDADRERFRTTAESEYLRTESQLEQQHNAAPSPDDVFWRLADETIDRLGDPRINGYELQQVYSLMARSLHESGRPHERLQLESHRCRRIYERQQIAQVDPSEAANWRAVVLANACCDECRALDGRAYTLDEAIESDLLPYSACTRGWCNCSWTNESPG